MNCEMNNKGIPLGIVFDLPICVHVPDQDYLVFNSDSHRGYFSVAFSKINADKDLERIGYVTRQFRYSRVIVGFPGADIRPICKKDPSTGDERWVKIVAPFCEPDLLRFHEECIVPMTVEYHLEQAAAIAGIRPVNRFLALYRQQTNNFFACGVSEVEPFHDLDQVSIYYFFPTTQESKHHRIMIETVLSPYIGSQIPDIPKAWNDKIYGKLQHEEGVPSYDEVLLAANYCFFKGMGRCAVVELEAVFELLIREDLTRAFKSRGDNQMKIDRFFSDHKYTRRQVSEYDARFGDKEFHEGGHKTYKLWNDAYKTYRNAVTHVGLLISAEETKKFFSDYNEVFHHLFGRSVWLNPLKHTMPSVEETI